MLLSFNKMEFKLLEITNQLSDLLNLNVEF